MAPRVYVVQNGLSGLAAALNGQYGYTWNGQSTVPSSGQIADDNAFETLLENSGIVSVTSAFTNVEN